MSTTIQPSVKCFFDKDTNTCTYVVSDPATKKAAIIDSVLDYAQPASETSTKSADELIQYTKDEGLSVEWILDSHIHADHLTGSFYLRSQLPGSKIGISSKIGQVQDTFGKLYNFPKSFFDNDGFDVKFNDGDTFNIGSMEVKALATPGHTPACTSYYVGDAVFVGDTIFQPDFGSARCDFPNGSSKTLFESITTKLFTLPEETRMFVGHDYIPAAREKKEFRWETTVGEQKSANIHMTKSESEFVNLRDTRDAQLGTPRLLLPAIQVNLRAGQLPAPEDDGKSYLKIPVNLFKKPEM